MKAESLSKSVGGARYFSWLKSGLASDLGLLRNTNRRPPVRVYGEGVSLVGVCLPSLSFD